MALTNEMIFYVICFFFTKLIITNLLTENGEGKVRRVVIGPPGKEIVRVLILLLLLINNNTVTC
jgi:hypothetical protein